MKKTALFLGLLIVFVAVLIIKGEDSPSSRGTGLAAFDAEIEHQAALCKDGHMEACETELRMAHLKQAAGK